MDVISRRTLLGGVTLLAAGSSAAFAQLASNDEVVELWPGPPPGSHGALITRKVDDQSRNPAQLDRWVTGIARPVMVVRRPVRPNGSAALIIPGGGYGFLSYDNEGTQQAAWLNALGVTAFILLYRLPGEGWANRAEVPLQDAQRAIRLVRAGATRFSIRPDRITVLGFSAGGHLAGSLATRHDERVYAPMDAADRLPARPDLAALVYPVVSLVAPFTHSGSRDMLLGAGSTTAERRARSVEQRVDEATPPIFLVHAADDGLVPPANSIALFQAMLARQRPTALHVFEDGGHGFGTRLPPDRSASAWPTLFAAFSARQGLAA